MFELDTPTKGKLVDVIVLSQKNRKPEDEPGAKIVLEVSLSNDVLSSFDGRLKSTLFTKNGATEKDATAALPGVEPASDMPDLTPIGQQMGTFKWKQQFTGYELAMKYGTGRAASNVGSEGCELTNVRITPKQGGTIVLKLNVEAPNVTESMFGKLARLKGREIEFALLAPKPDASQSRIE